GSPLQTHRMGHLADTPGSGVTAVEYRLPWGGTVRGQRWGPAPDRITLIHKPDTDLDSWGEVPALMARELGFGVVAFALPGHGLSDDPWPRGGLADVMVALINRAELPFRQVLITAGVTSRAALDVAPDLGRVALVCLSPHSPPDSGDPVRSPEAPKLFFA